MMRFIGVLTAEVGLVVLVHRLAGPWWRGVLAAPRDLAAAGAGDLLLTLVHLSAWLAAWWLLVGTLHDVGCELGRLRRGRGPASGRTRMAPRWVQRVVSQAVGSAMVLGALAGPAAAATAPAEGTAVAQVVSPPVPILDLPAPMPRPTDAPSAPPAPPTPPDAAVPDAAVPEEEVPVPGVEPSSAADSGPVAAAPVHVVAPGENLWVIARQHAAGGDGAIEDRQVHAYWVRLIAVNLTGLRSGDPDLIHPGERLLLPAPDDGGGL